MLRISNEKLAMVYPYFIQSGGGVCENVFVWRVGDLFHVRSSICYKFFNAEARQGEVFVCMGFCCIEKMLIKIFLGEMAELLGLGYFTQDAGGWLGSRRYWYGQCVQKKTPFNPVPYFFKDVVYLFIRELE